MFWHSSMSQRLTKSSIGWEIFRMKKCENSLCCGSSPNYACGFLRCHVIDSFMLPSIDSIGKKRLGQRSRKYCNIEELHSYYEIICFNCCMEISLFEYTYFVTAKDPYLWFFELQPTKNKERNTELIRIGLLTPLGKISDSIEMRKTRTI